MEPESTTQAQPPSMDVETRQKHLLVSKKVPQGSSTWLIGTSRKSSSVSEDGILRAFAFSRASLEGAIDAVPGVQDILDTLTSAIIEPSSDGSVRRRPRVAAFLDSSVVDADVVQQVKKYCNDEWGFDIVALRDIGLSAVKSDVKEEKVVAWNAEPPKRCSSCKQEIKGKAANCGGCRAVIYCGQECQVFSW